MCIVSTCQTVREVTLEHLVFERRDGALDSTRLCDDVDAVRVGEYHLLDALELSDDTLEAG